MCYKFIFNDNLFGYSDIGMLLDNFEAIKTEGKIFKDQLVASECNELINMMRHGIQTADGFIMFSSHKKLYLMRLCKALRTKLRDETLSDYTTALTPKQYATIVVLEHFDYMITHSRVVVMTDSGINA